MAQENEQIQKLVAARDRMISDRRALAEALASEYKGGAGIDGASDPVWSVRPPAI